MVYAATFICATKIFVTFVHSCSTFVHIALVIYFRYMFWWIISLHQWFLLLGLMDCPSTPHTHTHIYMYNHFSGRFLFHQIKQKYNHNCQMLCHNSTSNHNFSVITTSIFAIHNYNYNYSFKFVYQKFIISFLYSLYLSPFQPHYDTSIYFI